MVLTERKKYKQNRYCVQLFMYKGNIKTNPQTEIGPNLSKISEDESIKGFSCHRFVS